MNLRIQYSLMFNVQNRNMALTLIRLKHNCQNCHMIPFQRDFKQLNPLIVGLYCKDTLFFFTE